MNNSELMLMLLAGLILMCVPIAIQMRWYKVPIWKCTVISSVLVITGLLGSRLWYWVENQSFNGRSFYGVVFLAPLVFLPVALLLHIPYGYVLDFVAPGGCLTLALVKIQCLRDGCCAGMVLGLNENYEYILFPSQMVEMSVFLIISILLMLISYNKSGRNMVFPWFLVLYGGSRFVLDFFRGEKAPYALGLSAGSFWSVIAFVSGIIVLITMRNKYAKFKKRNGKRV